MPAPNAVLKLVGISGSTLIGLLYMVPCIIYDIISSVSPSFILSGIIEGGEVRLVARPTQ